LSKGVLVLDPAEGVGTDPKFSVDAKVVVLHQKGMDTEDLQQFIARGCRTLGVKEGTVFFDAPEAEQQVL
jgi:hypothetical protein